MNPLGTCRGARPWLGRHSREECDLPSRLLIRTASNAYFPQVLAVLSLPERGTAVQKVVAELWDDLQIVNDAANLALLKTKVAEKVAAFSDEEVLEAIRQRRTGQMVERGIKQVELDALLAAPEGFGEDVPVHPDFDAPRLPDHAWRRRADSKASRLLSQCERCRSDHRSISRVVVPSPSCLLMIAHRSAPS